VVHGGNALIEVTSGHEGVISGHLVTTFYYLAAKFSGVVAADTAVDGLLADVAVAGADKHLTKA
jgi:hypothetical protein